jgi:hypothetical protein
VSAFTVCGDSPEISYARATEFLGIGVENLIPAARQWQAKLEIVMRIAGEVDYTGNR